MSQSSSHSYLAGDTWDRLWATRAPKKQVILDEERTRRWQQVEQSIRWRFGSFEGLRVIEIGSGHGTNAINFARKGAKVTLLDLSARPLEQAAEVAESLGLHIETRVADLFASMEDLDGQFDVACSFGLVEHFADQRRVQVLATHLRLLASCGIAVISVPNYWAPHYRLWMALMKRRGTWPYGLEVPFRRKELVSLMENAGGDVLHVGFGSLQAELVNDALKALHAFRLTVPQLRSPLDFLAYEMLIVAQRRLRDQRCYGRDHLPS